MNNKFLFYCFIISLVFGFSINEINLRYIRNNNPANIELNCKSTIHNQTIWNIDNYFYLGQIKNFVSGKGFINDTDDPRYAVRRTPVYPLFYGMHYLVFGEVQSFRIIKYTQLLLCSLSVVLLCLAVFNFTGNKHWAAISALLYAVSPYTVIYCYFTITESLSPFLVILCLFAFSIFVKKKNNSALIFTGIAIGIASLNRPLLGILLISVCIFIILDNFSLNKKTILTKIKLLTLISISFLLTLMPWTIRNFIVTKGEIIPLEKFYGDQMGFGMGHLALMRWIGCWENPADFSPQTISNSLRKSIRNNENQDSYIIEKTINELPESAIKGYTKNDVKNSLQKLNGYYKSIFIKNYEPKIADTEVVNAFNNLSKQYKKTAPFSNYVITPLKFLKGIIFQSSSYPYAMLNPDHGTLSLFQKICKAGMYLMNVSLYITLIILMFNYKDKALKWSLCAFIALTFFYLIMVFRYMEARYSIPFYPVLYIAFGYVAAELVVKFRKSKT